MNNNEEQFRESIVLKSKFNRLVAFDSQLIHAGTGFTSREERLTMVIFLYDYHIEGEQVPLVRMRSFG